MKISDIRAATVDLTPTCLHRTTLDQSTRQRYGAVDLVDDARDVIARDPTAAALLGTGGWRGALGAPDPYRAAALRVRSGPPTLTETIAAFVNRARFEDLPAVVVQKTKELLVFSFSHAFQGAHGTKGGQINAIAPLLSQPRSGGASVIGQRHRLSVSDASFCEYQRRQP